MLVRIILSRSQAYEQEAIECTIKLYTKYNISSFLVKTQPSFDGFLIEDLNVQSYLGEREPQFSNDVCYTRRKAANSQLIPANTMSPYSVRFLSMTGLSRAQSLRTKTLQ